MRPRLPGLFCSQERGQHETKVGHAIPADGKGSVSDLLSVQEPFAFSTTLILIRVTNNLY